MLQSIPFSHRNRNAGPTPVPSRQVKQSVPRKSAVKRSVPRASGAFIRPLFPPSHPPPLIHSKSAFSGFSCSTSDARVTNKSSLRSRREIRRQSAYDKGVLVYKPPFEKNRGDGTGRYFSKSVGITSRSRSLPRAFSDSPHDGSNVKLTAWKRFNPASFHSSRAKCLSSISRSRPNKNIKTKRNEQNSQICKYPIVFSRSLSEQLYCCS